MGTDNKPLRIQQIDIESNKKSGGCEVSTWTKNVTFFAGTHHNVNYEYVCIYYIKTTLCKWFDDISNLSHEMCKVRCFSERHEYYPSCYAFMWSSQVDQPREITWINLRARGRYGSVFYASVWRIVESWACLETRTEQPTRHSTLMRV